MFLADRPWIFLCLKATYLGSSGGIAPLNLFTCSSLVAGVVAADAAPVAAAVLVAVEASLEPWPR